MPKTFVVVGESEWLSTSRRSTLMAYDSRMRRCQLISGGDWRSIFTEGSRWPGPTPQYFEAVNLSTSAAVQFGIAAAGSADSAASGTTNIGGQLEGWAVESGFIVSNSSNLQSGLGSTSAAGGVYGASIYTDADGGAFVQFYFDGVPYGSPEQIVANSPFFAGASILAPGVGLAFRFDASELQFLPAGAQPWGASARVADVGGYSPAATEYDPARVSATGLVIDDFRRTVAGTVSTAWRSVAGSTALGVLPLPRLTYFEIELESAFTGGHFGLVADGAALPTYAGQGALDWGWDFASGAKWNANTWVAVTGSTATAAGTVLGIIWDRVSKIWFVLDGGVLGSGDPETGANPCFSNVTSAVRVLFSAIFADGARARLRTHAREQLYRPSYAEAWDGADILPEQHYEGRLLPRTSFARAMQFALRGGASQRPAVGSVVIGNAAGEFDRLADWELRNQSVVGYYIGDTYSDREFTGVVDSIKRGGFAELEVRVGDTTSPLDLRVDAPICIVGEVARAPLIARQGTDLIFDVAPTALYAFSDLSGNASPVIDDGGLAVHTWARVPTSTNDPTAHLGAVKRTTKPIYRQSVTKLRQFSIDGDITGLNFTLNAWTGNTPNNWAKTETGGGTITSAASATAARIQGGGTLTNYAAIHQGALTHPHGGSEFDGQIVVGLHVTTNTSGDLQVALEEFTGAYPAGGLGTFVVTPAKIAGGGTGWFWVPLPPFSGVSLSFLSIYSARSGGIVDITVTEVRVLQCSAYRFPEVPGVVFATNADRTGQLRCSGEPAPISYWSDKRPTRRQLLAIEHESTLADWYSDAYGRVLTAFLTEPEAVLTTDACYIGDILEADVAGEIQDDDEGFPALSDLAWNAANFAVHSDTDIAADVASANRAVLLAEAQQHRLAVPGAGAAEAKVFHPFYAHGVGAPPWRRYVGPLLSTSPNPSFAGTDKDLIRLHRIVGVRRRLFDVPLKAAFFRTRKVRPGCVATLYHRRFGLAAGKRVQFLSAPPALMATTVVCKVIG